MIRRNIVLCTILGAGSAMACEPPHSAPTRLLRPADAQVSDGFGLREHPILKMVRPHNGIDFQAPIGTPVSAAAAGRIAETGYKGAFGNSILIEHGGGFATFYAHLRAVAPELKDGACVRPGDVIGYLGNTGLVAGPTLHFEVHRDGTPVDPAPLLETDTRN